MTRWHGVVGVVGGGGGGVWCVESVTVSDSDCPTGAKQFLARRDIYGVGRGWVVWLAGAIRGLSSVAKRQLTGKGEVIRLQERG